MIIDTHVHIFDGGWPLESPAGLSPQQMLEVMDTHNIQKVWISPVTGLVRDYKLYNDKLCQFAEASPDRFVKFCTVNPNYTNDAVDEIKRCVEVLGCKGLKLHPWLQGFSVTCKVVYRMIETCIKYNLPVIFHDGTPAYSCPLQISHLAGLYPEARIILGHSGLYDLYRNAIKAAKRYKNIYLCLCGPAISDIKNILKEVDNNRLFFGSDFGALSVSILAERIRVIDYAISNEQQKEKIFYTNASTFI